MDKPTPPIDIYAPSDEMKALMVSLVNDVVLELIHEHYAPLAGHLALLLAHGFKDDEIAGEFSLTSAELCALKTKAPPEWWERHRMASKRWTGRKRAKALTSETQNDFEVLKALDDAFNPKNKTDITSGGKPIVSVIEAKEQERVKQLFA
ncbi:MAG: hypothetical protein M0R37_14875 [Bacteroidales bacterium]|jgi:hypothetical protein|nr:hypothetical protein [Candidatus Colwellbacteria bacterium]MCK9599010.1 hypothetical protein [Sphaerochaeta sp.]MCK9629857.1 hypothetical protein [Bacteroidales bacterium]